MDKLDQAVMDRPLSMALFTELCEPMPQEALSVDDGRGFPLTSIKAAFVLERLTKIFGLLGYGWRYALSRHRFHESEVLVDVALQWRVTEDPDRDEYDRYCRPIYWGQRTDPSTGVVTDGWYPDDDRPAIWSEPVFATGGSSLNRAGSVPVTDAHRAAVTNALTKTAGRLGIGLEVFKGQNDRPMQKTGKKGRKKQAAQKRTARKKPAAPNPNQNAQAEFASIEDAQAAAKAAFERLTKVEDGPATTKDYTPLAAQCKKVGIRMQVVKLIWLLLGPGDTTKRRVMACHNFLLTPFGQESVPLLNEAARDVTWNGLLEE